MNSIPTMVLERKKILKDSTVDFVTHSTHHKMSIESALCGKNGWDYEELEVELEARGGLLGKRWFKENGEIFYRHPDYEVRYRILSEEERAQLKKC